MNRKMRSLKIFFIALAAVFTVASFSLKAQVRITDGAVVIMDANSLLELESTNKGLLIPRMAINDVNLPAPLTAPVPVGMQVYSTGGAIPDGFYFWNGSKWMGFSVSEVPVAKSASATLLKTETFVLASGDITLTLPLVTSADNGLLITVKNIGTHNDLISVIGNSSATIDDYTDLTLTRWQSRTCVAWNGNWITKNKEIRTENLLDVSLHGSFTTIAEVIEFLNAHISGPTVVRIGAGTYQIAGTLTINLPFPVTFEGLSFGESIIEATAGVSGNPLFICETESYFKRLIFNAIASTPGNDGIQFTGSGMYHEIKDCYFFGFNKGIVTTIDNDFWVFESDFEDCSGTGIEIAAGAASGGSFKISECDFTQCAIGIHLLSGLNETISVQNSTFYNTVSGTDIGILYVPGTFAPYSSIFITGNAWNNQGTFISGFDFSRSDGRDANAFLINNAGMENENPHCKINVINNATTTTVTSLGTYYKANWTNAASSYTCKWTLANNRITYQPNNGRDVWAIITGNITVDDNNLQVTIALVKNGASTIPASRYGETDLRIVTANQPFQFSTVVYVPEIKKNDYLELFVTSTQNGDIVIFRDVQWFTNTQ